MTMTHDKHDNDSISITRRHLLAGGLTLSTIPFSGCLSAVGNALGREPAYTIEDVNVTIGDGISIVDITKVETRHMLIGGKQIQVTFRVEPTETGVYRLRLAALDSDGTVMGEQSKTTTLYDNERSTFMLFTNHGGVPDKLPTRLVLYVLPESNFTEDDAR